MTIPLEAVLSDRYFDLDPDIYGAFALEAKIIDTVGAPSTSTALANLLHSTTGHSQTLTVSPNLNSQGTYDMSYNFAIQQDNDLTGTKHISKSKLPAYSKQYDTADNRCYSALINDYDALARGEFPTLERFERIRVDGGLPLAAWLEENTTTAGVSRNICRRKPAEDRCRTTAQPGASRKKVFGRGDRCWANELHLHRAMNSWYRCKILAHFTGLELAHRRRRGQWRPDWRGIGLCERLHDSDCSRCEEWLRCHPRQDFVSAATSACY